MHCATSTRSLVLSEKKLFHVINFLVRNIVSFIVAVKAKAVEVKKKRCRCYEEKELERDCSTNDKQKTSEKGDGEGLQYEEEYSATVTDDCGQQQQMMNLHM